MDTINIKKTEFLNFRQIRHFYVEITLITN